MAGKLAGSRDYLVVLTADKRGNWRAGSMVDVTAESTAVYSATCWVVLKVALLVSWSAAGWVAWLVQHSAASKDQRLAV
mgnify:CR=1 FL=1